MAHDKAHIAAASLLAAALLLGGCAGPAAPADSAEDRRKQGAREPSEHTAFLIADAVAENDGEGALRAAQVEARRELADLVAKRVRESLKAFFAHRNGGPSPEEPFSAEYRRELASEVAASLLREVSAGEQQGQSGRRRVRYSLPVAAVDRQMVRRVRQASSDYNPFGKPPELAARALSQFLAERSRADKLAATRARKESPDAEEGYRLPDWLRTGRHEDYPPERYFTAIGVGLDAAGARQSGLAELVTRVQNRLTSLATRLRGDAASGALAANLTALGPGEIRFTADDLVATRNPETWHDPVTDTHYVLAAIDRETAVLVLRRRLEEAAGRSSQLYASARNHRKAGNHGAALRAYLDTLAAAREAALLQLKALAVVPEQADEEFREALERPVLTEAAAQIRSLLEGAEVSTIGGNRQWVRRDAPPPEPFVVKVTAGPEEAAFEDVCVRFSTAGHPESALAQAWTDATGTARWKPTQPLPPRHGEGRIVASLDLEKMAPEAATKGLPLPSARFVYLLRSARNTAFAVSLEGDAGKAVGTSLAEALRGEGFQQAHGGAAPVVPSEPGGKPEDADILEAFQHIRENLQERRFLLVVWGRAETEVMERQQTSEGTLHIVYCSFRLRVLDADMPRGEATVLTVEGQGRGAYLEDESEAARRARADAAEQASERLVRGLRGKLGPASP